MEVTTTAQHLPLLERLYGDLKSASIIFAAVVIALTLAMLVDFVLGICKSLLAGRKIQSFRLRKSALKVVVYYGALAFCYLFDLIFVSIGIYEMPYLSGLIGAGFVLTEITSWFEKLSDKEQARIEQSARVMSSAISSVLTGKFNIAEVIKGLGKSQQETK